MAVEHAPTEHIHVDPTQSPAWDDAAAALNTELSGEVRFDEYARVLYATDGSIYGAQPAGVVFPHDAADVQRTLKIADRFGLPVLARGAGTSLAGQAVGPGCLVLDLSRHLNDIVSIDPENRRVTVQPGVVQDDLDAALAPHGLKFAPDPASSARATVGGGIGNNSTGAHSVRYGITDAYTESLTVVLADGSRIKTREVILDSDEWESIVSQSTLEAQLYQTVRELVESTQAEIDARYPTLKRSVSGYNLHKVVYETDTGDRAINLSKLFVGAEGTLGVVVEAELSLVTKPEHTALALYCFDDLIAAMAAVPVALEHPVSGVELMDEEVFRLAADSTAYREYAAQIPDGTAASLLIEFDNEVIGSGDRSAFSDSIDTLSAELLVSGDAFDVIEAYEDAEQADLWNLRKAAIPLLMSLEGDAKPYPFIEDASVPPEELAAYVSAFRDILEDHGTSAAYFAHAGSGTLHIRPILSLKETDGIETMHSITDAVTDLVLEHHGAFSGEHGDGLARTEFNPKMYGETLWTAFQDLKTAFDPEWRMNPGKVVYTDSNPTDMREHLRYGSEYETVGWETTLDFSEEGGFSHLVELCNGCGTCRQTGSGTMCPTYRATKDEQQTTRGRANMIRAAISGELPSDALHSAEFHDAILDMCIGCKGCKRDCPTGVDLAKLKAEIKHKTHEERSPSIRDRLFADIERFSNLASTLAPLSNIGPKLPGARWVMEQTLGIARERELPSFTRTTLVDWFETRGGSTVSTSDATDRVLLFPDTYTNYSYPEPGKAAVRVLEAAGVYVEIPTHLEVSGRAAYSLGFLDRAQAAAQTNVELLRPFVEDGRSIVFVEPSDAVMFQDEYQSLVSGEDTQLVGANAYGVLEYLDIYRRDENVSVTPPAESIAYHGHCNQKALSKDHHAPAVLDRLGFDVSVLDSGCCGMAGSFGYETEHYELSQSIGSILFAQVEENGATTVTAPGGSCRSQLGDRGQEAMPPHPIELIDRHISL